MRQAFVYLAAFAAIGRAAAAAETTLDAETAVGPPASYKNLTFYPLVARGPSAAPAGDYLVLDEGLKSGKVHVVEKGDAEVNFLTLENRSQRPLFVMSGEVVIGGKQDRIIGKDAIIGAGEVVNVPVYCVEHGRWTESTDGRRFRSAGSMADTKVRKKAAYKDSQSEVWKEVAAKNQTRGIANSTGTYRQVAAGDGGVSKAVEPYAKNLDPALTGPAIVGMVVALNGRVVGIEQFASPALFAKLKGKLARSYYVDAVDEPLVAGSTTPTVEDMQGFAARAASGKESVVATHRTARTTRKQGSGVVGSEVTEDKSPAKPVYKSVHTDE
jgi:hypothetical protein